MTRNIRGRNRFIACLASLAIAACISNTGAAWVNAIGNLNGLPTECGDFHSIYAIPNANMTTVGLANNGFYATTNGGTSWTKMTDSTKTRIMQMLFDPDHPDTWYAGGIYHFPGIWKTTDAGTTWVGFYGIGSTDGIAVDFTDPARKTLLASSHETQGKLYKSTDAGATWTDIGCPTGGISSFPYIINTQTYLMGIQSVGMYRSTDAGATWTLVSPTPPLTHMLKTSAGDLYYSGNNFKVVRGSSDGITWTVLNSSNVAGAAPIEIPGGKIAVINYNGIDISSDKGTTWKTKRCSPIAPAITSFWAFTALIGFTYNSVAGAFYTCKWGCVNNVASDEIWRYDTLIGSTNAVYPQHAIRSVLTTAPKDGAVFDIAGRNVRDNSFVNKSGALSTKVYFVRNSNGLISKRISD